MQAEKITDAAFGTNEFRMTRIPLYFSAQAQDQDINRPVENIRVIAAQAFEQLIARQDSVGVSAKRFEQ